MIKEKKSSLKKHSGFEKKDARSVAFEALSQFFIKGYDIESVVDKLFDKKDRITGEYLISQQEKNLSFEIIYGILRNKSRLDFAIDKYLVQAVQKEEKLKIILEIGAYQILFMTRIPDFAAVNESVNLCKKNTQTVKFSNLVNAVLRKLLTNKNKALEIPNNFSFAEKIALEYSHPLWLTQKWIEQFGKTPTQKILEYNNTIPNIFVRRNSLLANKNKFEAMIAKNCEGSVKSTGFNNLYYRVKSGEKFEKSDLFLAGQCTIQSPSSGWTVALLDVKNNKSVLDLCAAPGGKTALIAEIAPNSRILAADISFNRAKMISNMLKRLLIKNVDLVVSDGRKLSVREEFDYVLVDVPCSATGVINRHPESRWIRSPDTIEKSAEKQKDIFNEAAKFVNIGGTIVYSTCSLEKEENKEVVEYFLKNNKNFKLIPAKTIILDSQLLSSDGNFLEITPNKNANDAIFAAKFERTE
ncbi:MAG: 16S rRNA (cytosine(967)-C(5))-methyltransferase RsmB [Chitinispirillales bacterium]|jgi:16S rRNA (cytosine967-C5)-methyltransferase|nr:16S rRNA (cytosine(967)-C(5))-methyltransferase RsmB [Chitinispirillales bacterium]